MSSSATSPFVVKTISVERQPGHWLLASMGKRVLRPGGLELTDWMLAELAIGPQDRVTEFAPGMGATARRVLARAPRDYVAIEREPAAAARLQALMAERGGRCVVASAEATGLPDADRTVVYGEAMLSMQTAEQKNRIVAEAARLLAPGGRYGIHELCLTPDNIDASLQREIQRDMSREIHVGVQPVPASDWYRLMESHGLRIQQERRAPMRLLEPSRLLRDEGWWGALRFASNVLRHPAARARVRAMRRLFRRYDGHLQAISLVAVRV